MALLLVSMMLTGLLGGCSGSSDRTPAAGEAATQEAAPAEAPADEEKADGEQKEGPTNPDAVIISFWNGFGGSDRPVLEDLVKRFNESQDEVYVDMEIMDWEILYEKLTMAAATQEGPDFICFGPENIATYANMGAIVPIDDFYERKLVDETLFPELFSQLIRYDGHYIGMPLNFYSHAMYYNKDLAAAAGLDPENPPTNWDELAEWAVAMTDEANGQYGLYLDTSWVNTVQFMWENGGDIMDYSTKTGTINQPGAVGAVEFFSDLYRNKKVSPAVGTDAGQMFTAGKLGILLDGPWQSVQIKEAGVNYGLALMPSGPVKQATFGAGISFHLTNIGAADEARKEAFYTFLQYWFDKETQREWCSRIGFPPIRTDMENDEELLTSNPDLKIFMESSDIAQPWLLGIVNSQKLINDITKKYFDEVYLNGMDVQEAMDRANEEIDKLMATEK